MTRIMTLAKRVNSWCGGAGLGRSQFVRRIKGTLRWPLYIADLSASGRGADPVLLLVDGLPKIVIYPADGHSLDALFSRYYQDRRAVQLFRQALGPGDVVLDIGANIGYWSLIAAKAVGPEGVVYAFEPAPDNFTALETNVRLNGYRNIVPVQRAVGSARGPATLLLMDHGGASHGLYPHPRIAVKGTAQVESATIDEFLDGRTAHVIKIDIEGGEPRALEGMKKTICGSDRCVLISELHPTMLAQAGFTAKAYLRQLRDLGFDVSMIDEESGRLSGVSLEHVRRRSEESAWWYTNLYCVRR